MNKPRSKQEATESRKVLERALDLITRSWIRNHEAMDSEGRVVDPRSKGACSWCALGAMKRAAREIIPDPDLSYSQRFENCPPVVLAGSVAKEMLYEMYRKAEVWPNWTMKISTLNDIYGLKREKVEEMFTEAIRRARIEEEGA